MTHRILLGLLLSILGISGCGSSTQTVELRRDHSDQVFAVTFDRAFYLQTSDGQLEVVLVSGGPSKSSTNQPLVTSGEKSVRQIVHLKILWQKPRGYRIDNPAATNSTLTWYVIAGPHDRLIYTGSAWTRASQNQGSVELDIRNATLTINRVVGQVQDPLKRVTFAGTLMARRSETAVRSFVEELASYRSTDSSTALSDSATNNTPTN